MSNGILRAKDQFCIPGTDMWTSRLGLGGAPTGGHGWGARDDESAVEAICRAARSGITFFDTADVYGLGLAERLLRKGLDEVPGVLARSVIATKGGVRWDEQGRTVRDSSPTYLMAAAEASMRRLRVDCIPLYYLHWQDGQTPLEDSLGALCRLRDQGKVRAIGLSNVGASELWHCATSCIAAVQVKGNLLEPDELFSIAVAASAIGAAVVCFSALADGLLTGKIGLDRVFAEDDHRIRYPLFRKGVFEEALKRIELLRVTARALKRSPSQVALRWILETPAASAVLCGAKTPGQIEENAGALGWDLAIEDLDFLASKVPMATCAPFETWRRQIARQVGRATA